MSLLPVSLWNGGTAFADTAVTSGQVTIVRNAGTGTPGQAPKESEAKVTKTEAEALVRKLFPVLNKAELRQISFGSQNQYPPSTMALWDMNWSYTIGNSSYGFSTQVDAMTGDLLNVYLPSVLQEENTTYYPPKINREQAQAIALAFLKEAAPSIPIDSIKPVDEQQLHVPQALFGPVNHYFQYEIPVNGLKAGLESAAVAVDGNGGITQYHYQRYQGEYPSLEGIIGESEALAKMQERVELEPAYIQTDGYRYPPSLEKETWALAYVPKPGTFLPLDAKTGEAYQSHTGVTNGGEVTYEKIASGGTSFVARKSEEPLTGEEARAIALEHVTIPEGYVESNSSLEQDWRDPQRKAWRLYWREGEMPFNGYMKQVSASVDAATGQLLEYRQDLYGPPIGEQAQEQVKPTIDAVQAKNKALEAIKRLYPDASDTLRLAAYADGIEAGKDGKYRYQFHLWHGEYRVHNHSVNLTLDGEGGLSSYDAGVSADRVAESLAAAAAAPQVTKDAAEAAFKAALQAVLTYQRTGGYFVDGYYEEEAIAALYVPELDGKRIGGWIDASTGEVAAYDSPMPVDGTGSALDVSDIEGHWASEALATMVEYGVLKPDENAKLYPNKKLTAGEWFDMVFRAFTGGSEYYGGSYGMEEKPLFADVPAGSEQAATIGYFVDRRWLEQDPNKELGLDTELSREQLAVYLTQMVQYDKLASIMKADPDIRNARDYAAIADAGSAAIAYKLGLLGIHQGKFNPDAIVTRAEAAAVLMRLVALQGKLDTNFTQY